MEERHNFSVKFDCYMAELYVSTLIDCLYPNQSRDRPTLEIREDHGTTFIKNITTMSIDSLDTAMAVFHRGIKNRKVYATKMNDMSSRSHVIFTVVIQCINNENG